MLQVPGVVFSIEIEREDDGRWPAEVPAVAGVMCYGGMKTRKRKRGGWMRGSIIGVLLLAVTATVATAQKRSMKADLVFLTRDGCVNTPDMVNNLDDALKALGWENDYPVHRHREAAEDGRAHRLSDTDTALEGQGHLRDARPKAPFPEPA